jgi:hypothetical protein
MAQICRLIRLACWILGLLSMLAAVDIRLAHLTNPELFGRFRLG